MHSNYVAGHSAMTVDPAIAGFGQGGHNKGLGLNIDLSNK